MRKAFFVLFVLIKLISCSILALGQNIPQININLIITTSGDTIKSPIIKTNFSDSNESQVTYFKDKTLLILNATDIISYFDGTDKYYAAIIKDKGGKKLIKYVVTGPLYFAQSFNRKGESSLYLKLREENAFINLETKTSDIKSFLKQYLSDYDQFRSTYKKRINYEFESLAEFVSAYNAFKEPANYVALEFKKQQTLKFGLYGSYNFNQLKLDKTLNNTAIPSFSIGLLLSNQYTRSLSLDILSTYTVSNFEFDNKEKPMLRTINLEPTLRIGYYINDNSCVKINAGPVIMYNLGSKVELVNGSINIKGLNVGYTAGASFQVKSKYTFFINYLNYKFKTNNYNPSSLESSSKDGILGSYRIGFSLTF